MKEEFIETKKYYRKLLDDTITLVEENCEKNPSALYFNFYSQLMDLKKNVVELEILTEWDEINERYSFVGLAAKNMDDDDELRQKLREIFFGAIHYIDYPEE